MAGGMSDGVQLVEVRSDDLSFTVIPTRGMGLWKGSYRGMPLTWGSPVPGPVHPRLVELSLGGGRGWLGGFDEWVVRCGLSSNGVPGLDSWVDEHGIERTETLTQHGRIANVPAHRASVEVLAGPPFRIRVVGEVIETAFFGPRLLLRTTYEHVPGTGVLSIKDEVENLGGRTAELELLYHLNFGEPLVGDGARIHVAADEIAPYTREAAGGILEYGACVAPVAGRPEEVFLCVPRGDADGFGAALLESGGGDSGVLVRYDRSTLPWFIIWKLLADPRDGYVVGLEPSTNFPNLRTFERTQGRVQRLEPGETRTFRVSMELLAGAPRGERGAGAVDGVQGANGPSPPSFHGTSVHGSVIDGREGVGLIALAVSSADPHTHHRNDTSLPWVERVDAGARTGDTPAVWIGTAQLLDAFGEVAGRARPPSLAGTVRPVRGTLTRPCRGQTTRGAPVCREQQRDQHRTEDGDEDAAARDRPGSTGCRRRMWRRDSIPGNADADRQWKRRGGPGPECRHQRHTRDGHARRLFPARRRPRWPPQPGSPWARGHRRTTDSSASGSTRIHPIR